MPKTISSLRAATKRGLTLIEALLFLGIAAIVIVGAVILYNNSSNSARTNDALTQIQAYSTGIKGLHSGSSNYGTTTLVAAAINGGVAPRNAINGTALVNPWGGITTIMGQGASFRISMAGVPQDSCVRMVTAGLMTTGGIYAIRTGSNSGAVGSTATPVAPTAHAATANNGAFVATTNPTPAMAAAACSSGSTNNMHFFVR